MKKTVWLGALFLTAVLAYLVISSFRPQGFRCRVCVNYNGRRDCRTASAETREGAERAATSNACAQVASGVIESSQCESGPPESVDWLR